MGKKKKKRKMNKNSNYQLNRNQKEHYVVFLDVLGYSEKVLDAEKRKKGSSISLYKKLKKLMDTLAYEKFVEEIMHFPKGIFKYKDEFKANIALFSDNIFISVECPTSKKGEDTSKKSIEFFLMLCYIVLNLQSYALKEFKLLLRGGIVKGLCIHDTNFVFGEALIKAVALEKNAEYARVQIENEIVHEILVYIKNARNKELHRTLLYTLIKEDCQFYTNSFIVPPLYKYEVADDENNYEFPELSTLVSGLEWLGNDTQMCIKNLTEAQKSVSAIVEEYVNSTDITNLDVLTNRKKIIKKIEWLVDYFNLCCAVFKSTERLSIDKKKFEKVSTTLCEITQTLKEEQP